MCGVCECVRVCVGGGGRMEDDLVCDYDSTWDTESDGDDAGTVNAARPPGPNKKNKPAFVCSYLLLLLLIITSHRSHLLYNINVQTIMYYIYI